tara:strand:+ start:593 stop:712 length:120 start_codon:yes stop_codon:yes gene_type:complete
MTGNYGAIAEGFFESHGWLTSLGKTRNCLLIGGVLDIKL